MKSSRWSLCPFLLLLLLLNAHTSESCSPGPRYSSRHRHQRLTPLVRGQFIPSVSEATIGASGPAETPITRRSPEFSNLVQIYNPDIVFTDDENDGSDRMMTQRCKDKTNTLSILVMNRWPGIRLRVTEAWDSGRQHPVGSLHYEGRAVDLTTSDRDTTKYGILARLAVEAGFDWVYYKSKYYIHASVRPDNSEVGPYGGCFPENSLVFTKNNQATPMLDLAPGEKVLSVDRETGTLIYSDVIMMMDRQTDVMARFLEVTTPDAKLTLTGNHIVYAFDESRSNCQENRSLERNWISSVNPVYARNLKVGQRVYVSDRPDRDRFPTFSRIVRIREVVRKGVIAPLTRHGTIVVDNVVASCYSAFYSESIAHASFVPARTFEYFRNSDNNTQGVHWYARTLSRVASFLFPKSFFLFE